MTNEQNKTAKLSKMAMLAAISIVLVLLVHFPLIPAAAFLEYDPADIPIFIGTFAFGPVAGVILTVVVSVIQGLTVSAGGQIWGIIMHIIATGAFAIVAGNIYGKHKTNIRRMRAFVDMITSSDKFDTSIYGIGDGISVSILR